MTDPKQTTLRLLRGNRLQGEVPADDVRAAKQISEAVGVNVHPVMRQVLEPFARQPHSHSAGPRTSQDAGDEHTDSGKRETNAMRVLKAVHRWHGYRATGLHALLSAHESYGKPVLSLTEVRRRLTDLQALDYVQKGERHGREFTWQITTAGLLKLSTVYPEMGRR